MLAGKKCPNGQPCPIRFNIANITNNFNDLSENICQSNSPIKKATEYSEISKTLKFEWKMLNQLSKFA